MKTRGINSLRKVLLKKFSSVSTASIRSNDIHFCKEIEVLSKFAIIIELRNSKPQIIFPDKKVSLLFDLSNPNQTVQDLINDYRKRSEKDNILGCMFTDIEGVPIANQTKAALLTRLPSFKIMIDNGEKIYDCINANYLGNSSLDTTISHSHIPVDIKWLNQKTIESNLTFREAIRRSSVKNEKQMTFRDILQSIYDNKYLQLNEIEGSILTNKNTRASKIINLFYYITLTQVVALNLFTFVFLNWDIMEPITQCLTFANIIVGYYFWAFTQTSLDPPSFLSYFTSKSRLHRKRIFKELSVEREQIKELLERNNRI